MLTDTFKEERQLKKAKSSYHLVVIGGGLAGTCAALAAARSGIHVALIHDRPVLGGNASSEVRLWALGATSHMGNNNRWAREGGIINEIMLENLYRNREGNPIIFDTILIDKIIKEEKIDLYLNTSVFGLSKNGCRIHKVHAFNAQNSTLYDIQGEVFIDSSGDGIIAYQAGLPYRMGAEDSEEFSEPLAKNKDEYGELLGHTLFFYSKKADTAVKYIPPDFALKDHSKIPKIHKVKAGVDGCNLWWFEYGGVRDTVHDTEEIKFELWKVAYGVWDYIKNSGKFDNADKLTLEWVGLIPGKRESRRFIGEYMLTQSDIIKQNTFDDAISFGGWAIDLHPSEGIYSELDSCSQWHSKGIYQIPFRCYFSSLVDNLLLAGRIISVSHIAFGSTRVMATTAHGGQAIGLVAATCVQNKCTPNELLKSPLFGSLQQALLETGHYIPGIQASQDENLLRTARIDSSSNLDLTEFPHDGGWERLEYSKAQMLPAPPENKLAMRLNIRSDRETILLVQLRISTSRSNHTPDIILQQQEISLKAGMNNTEIFFSTAYIDDQYLYVCFLSNSHVELPTSARRITGILALYNQTNKAVSNYGRQIPPEDSEIEEFEFWTPRRRPGGQNIACSFRNSIYKSSVKNLFNGINRPVRQPNAWIAGEKDRYPVLKISWEKPQMISEIILYLDPDYDHPLESVQMIHPEQYIPFILRDFTVEDEHSQIVLRVENNHEAISKTVLKNSISTSSLLFRFAKPTADIPVAIFSIVCK